MTRFLWLLRMTVAEAGLDFWFWLAAHHVPVITLERFRAFTATLPDEYDHRTGLFHVKQYVGQTHVDSGNIAHTPPVFTLDTSKH